MRAWLLGIVALAVLLVPPPIIAGPSGCVIGEGAAIGGARIGTSVAEALAITGGAVRQQPAGSQVTYDLRAPWTRLVAEGGLVVRIGTRSAACRTARGVGPGSTLTQIRQAYAGVEITTVTAVADGQALSYPFVGITFILKDDRADAVEVFRAEILAGGPAAPVQATPARPGAAAPSPTPAAAPGSWSVRSATARVDGTDLIISGTVDNRSRTQNVYVEVAALTAAGQRVGEGNGPVQPGPVPAGASGRFEVRIAITDVVRRFIVTVRPVGGGPRLAEFSGEIRTAAAFGEIISRQVQVQVQAGSPNPTRGEFTVNVMNGSAFTLSRVTVTAQISATCRLTAETPPRFVQETWTGTATVQQMSPGASARAPLSLSGGLCQGVVVQWSATARATEVSISE
jgi:hypothetical protein